MIRFRVDATALATPDRRQCLPGTAFQSWSPGVKIKPVTVAPATKVTILAGPGQQADGINGFVTFRFRVDAATGPCGPLLGMHLAQERLTDYHFIVPPFPVGALPDDEEWVPEEANPPAL